MKRSRGEEPEGEQGIEVGKELLSVRLKTGEMGEEK